MWYRLVVEIHRAFGAGNGPTGTLTKRSGQRVSPPHKEHSFARRDRVGACAGGVQDRCSSEVRQSNCFFLEGHHV